MLWSALTSHTGDDSWYRYIYRQPNDTVTKVTMVVDMKIIRFVDVMTKN